MKVPHESHLMKKCNVEIKELALELANEEMKMSFWGHPFEGAVSDGGVCH